MSKNQYTIHYRKEKHLFHITNNEEESNIEALKQAIHQQFNISPSKQTLLPIPSHTNQYKLIGTAETEHLIMQQSQEKAETFQENRRQFMAKKHTIPVNNNRELPSEYRFLVIQTHETKELQSNQAILERIRTDTAVIQIMIQRRYTVGVLKELSLDSLMELLGLNTNAGQMIQLRLRTYDLEGWRPYFLIIETLMHELAHNEISNHNDEFHALTSSLQRQYQEITRRSRLGRKISDDETFNGIWEYDRAKEDHTDRGAETTHILGTALSHSNGEVISQRDAIREAAEKRARE